MLPMAWKCPCSPSCRCVPVLTGTCLTLPVSKGVNVLVARWLSECVWVCGCGGVAP